MPTPKYRKSKSKRNMRRAHDALRAPAISYCPNCNEPKRPHMVCGACGHYRGAQVMEARKTGTTGDFSAEDFEVEA